ncbi:LysR family transcriptional regulator [Pseudooceanicola sp. CBS1P-1]|uniref:LysR family transcriptional regulator n=1 Tax=Pseudooceanicola albus TaxID=2692189 RepID=A0A6L7GAI7_9RHOB|nr:MULTISPECIES: LysR family transcriptional regulator [Pseudooceanicola]MBT9387047.1 LysR family transcriptional regulator [Pseudooceanicola endophyticus]MXN21214.1 LysR family transcriptional regulator [Pseudooceanicola albus]
MDLATLRVFRAVAREESVTRAADLLGRAPSNVTTRIQQLEAELGTQLFHRNRKRMILSDAGRIFADYAERILNLADEAQQRLDPSSPRGTLRVGSMESTIASRLAGPLSRFSRAWPEAQLELTSAPSAPLLDALRACRIDCALVAFPPDGDIGEPLDLETQPLFREDLVLLLPSDHPEIRVPADLRLRTLAAFGPGCTYRKLAEDWLMSDGGSGVRIQEVPSYHAMYGCTAAGACISIMPKSVAELMGSSGSVLAVPLMQVVTHLAWRTGFDTASLRAFRACLTEGSNLQEHTDHAQ